uniref:Uncharacterized protein n=1 Tax=Arundo donax TaxID=35708 RepID=A0A0A9CWB4_ARUDO
MVSLGSSFAFTLFNTYVADLFFPVRPPGRSFYGRGLARVSTYLISDTRVSTHNYINYYPNHCSSNNNKAFSLSKLGKLEIKFIKFIRINIK